MIADDQLNTWVFIRENSEQQVLVALNAGDDAANLDLGEIGEGWTPVFGNGSDTPPQVTIPPLEGRVWTRTR